MERKISRCKKIQTQKIGLMAYQVKDFPQEANLGSIYFINIIIPNNLLARGTWEGRKENHLQEDDTTNKNTRKPPKITRPRS